MHSTSRIGSEMLFPVYDLIQGKRLELRVPGHRLGDVPAHRLRRPGQQRRDLRLLRLGRLGGDSDRVLRTNFFGAAVVKLVG